MSTVFGVTFYERETLIVFDEIQLFPLARQALKALVKDGRYDFIETGSLISIKKNIKNILIPSEEYKITLNPMDFEEFLWAINKDVIFNNIRQYFINKMPLGEAIHRTILKDFRLYMLIGGMPGVVKEYICTNDYEKVEQIKKSILELYRNDISKANGKIIEKVKLIFESIPAQLSKINKKFQFSAVSPDTTNRYFDTAFKWLEQSKMINISKATNLPTLDLKSNIDYSKKKIYFLDTGLLITLALENKELVDKDIFKSILLDKLHINEGMFFENIVAQQLVASNNSLVYYYGNAIKGSKKYHNTDFIIQNNKKLSLLEIKSSSYKNYPSLDAIKNKFSKLLGDSYIIYTKDFKKELNTIYLPVYMVGLL